MTVGRYAGVAVAAALVALALWQLGIGNNAAALMAGCMALLFLAGSVFEELVFVSTKTAATQRQIAWGLLAAALLFLTMGSLGVVGVYGTPSAGSFLLGIGVMGSLVGLWTQRGGR